MTLQIEEQYTARWFTPGSGLRTSFTWHWWDLPEHHPTFDGVVNQFVNSDRQTSANYVVEAGRAACLVSPNDTAWANGDFAANQTSISIEANPRQTDGDYETGAQLLAYLYGIYGELPLFGHNHWTSTTCPGTYDLNRLRTRSLEIHRGSKPPAPSKPVTPAKPTTPVKPTPKPVINIAQLAIDTIAGKYGNGDERKRRLGANYNAVMAEVNKRLGAKPAPKPVVNIQQLATDTIAGKYGNGDARRKALGANYDAVQAEINRRYAQ